MTTKPVQIDPTSTADAEQEPSIGNLVADATRDISTLIQKEIELAKTELKVSVSIGVKAVVCLAVAGFIAVLALVLLSFAFVYLIFWGGNGLDLQWAFLIVTGAYLLIAGLFVLIGIKSFKKVRAPERSIRQAKQIPPALKGKA